MSFEDKTIVCVDCGAEFIHSAADQQRYAERGFEHEPRRCRTCRDKRKAQGGGGGGGGRGGYGGGGGDRPQRQGGFGNRERAGGGGPRSSYGGGGGGQREFFEATCSECGATTTVPFKPTSGRPVYCRDCYRARKP
jgi:CxxC-x17-CxxC domain-containing protein